MGPSLVTGARYKTLTYDSERWDAFPRRPGDITAMWADARLAKKKLGWTAVRDVERMCADHWRWQKNNPEGYAATLPR